MTTNIASAKTYKKEYCANSEYYPSSHKPYLHCFDWKIVYSHSTNGHNTLIDGDDVRCPAINEVLQTHHNGALHDAVQRMHNHYC